MTLKERSISPTIQQEMPEEVRPGSLLTMVQNPLISLLWELADATKLSQIKSVENWFSKQFNKTI
jgi:hypothetical protein